MDGERIDERQLRRGLRPRRLKWPRQRADTHGVTQRIRNGVGVSMLALGVALSAAGQGPAAAAPLTLGMVSLLPTILGPSPR
jgi:hypothetical protein